MELFCEQAVQFDFAAVVLKSAGRVTSSGGGQNVINEMTSTYEDAIKCDTVKRQKAKMRRDKIMIEVV